ncbi:hypothetical protein CJD_2064 [Clostridium perfringens D str. JGS1721]|uniref:Uncharacterized protein n=1 Tax=Clostridium perfringens D str. JGS1721 TaxID=488537 RepID=B1V105_CLOPF|nr:hypothetical protein CJD_2064 [Clostridium perfringens D str. JGS1721]DAI61742.1 MAG TPA: hypothetical protein [Caudoviricetes sp.]
MILKAFLEKNKLNSIKIQRNFHKNLILYLSFKSLNRI